MAKPIKETPILRGKDAARFMANHKASAEASVDRKEKQRILTNFQRLQERAKF